MLKNDKWEKEKYYLLFKNYFINQPLDDAFGGIISSNNAYIGLLNATEVSYAGFTTTYETNGNYLYTGNSWLILASYLGENMGVSYSRLNTCFDCAPRPAVTLNKDVAVSGQGTKSDPYVVQ